MAIVRSPNDHIEVSLAKLGLGQLDGAGAYVEGSGPFDMYDVDKPGTPSDYARLLAEPATIAQYNVVFFPCGGNSGTTCDATDAHPGDAASQQTLRDYVASGGKLYATDYSYEYVRQSWPGFVAWQGEAPALGTACLETPYDAPATAEDKGLAAWLGAQGDTSFSVEANWTRLSKVTPGAGRDPTGAPHRGRPRHGAPRPGEGAPPRPPRGRARLRRPVVPLTNDGRLRLCAARRCDVASAQPETRWTMLTRRVALVDNTGKVPFEKLSKVAAAINLQVQRDAGPIWNLHATVSAVASAAALPVGVAPIFIVSNLPPGEGGVHLTKNKQPYALVEYGEGWTVAASHECLEMLVDPGGNHLHPSTAVAIKNGELVDAPSEGKFQYLVEVCDPSEDDPLSYAIDDVAVSDFYTPNYFDPTFAAGVRYSFTGGVRRPREVRKNGYLSWFNPQTGTMQQFKNFDKPEIVDLGTADGACLRAFVDGRSRPTVAISKRKKATSAMLKSAADRGPALGKASRKNARLYELPKPATKAKAKAKAKAKKTTAKKTAAKKTAAKKTA